MKKILSVFLAVMMLFGAMSISASAGVDADGILGGYKVNVGFNPSNNLLVILDFSDCSSYAEIPNCVDQTTGELYVAPIGTTGKLVVVASKNSEFILPLITPPAGYTTNGWYSPTLEDNFVAGRGSSVEFAEGSQDTVVYFVANTYPGAPEEDTLGNILSILTKVFGAIIGILFYGGSTEAGVALMEKVLGGLDL